MTTASETSAVRAAPLLAQHDLRNILVAVRAVYQPRLGGNGH